MGAKAVVKLRWVGGRDSGITVTVGESKNISRAHTGQITYLGHENTSDTLFVNYRKKGERRHGVGRAAVTVSNRDDEERPARCGLPN